MSGTRESGDACRGVLITGASTGIGAACAARLAQAGWRVYAGVRRTRDGERLEQELGPNVKAVRLDVTDEEGLAATVARIAEERGAAGLQGLVNNAGIAVAGPVEELPVKAFAHQFAVNFFGVVAVTKATLPLLRRGRASVVGGPVRIVQMSSVSGRVAYPFFAPYAASKYALEAYSDSLRRELQCRDIGVVIIEPGAVETPIWEKAAEAKLAERFADTAYGPALARLAEGFANWRDKMLPVATVAAAVEKGLTARRPRLRYVLPDNRLEWMIGQLLPDRWIDRIAAKKLGLQASRADTGGADDGAAGSRTTSA